MSCHLGFFVWNGSAFIVVAGSSELPFWVTHIENRLTYPTIISIWQDMAAHMSNWRLICGTYTHQAQNTIYIVAGSAWCAYNVICPTIPIYKPSFWFKIQKWFDICLKGQIYVCSVRYKSHLSDICPTIPIYKLSFCISIQIWFDICLPCRIYIRIVGYMSWHMLICSTNWNTWTQKAGYMTVCHDIYQTVLVYEPVCFSNTYKSRCICALTRHLSCLFDIWHATRLLLFKMVGHARLFCSF